jgi:hypothetical protein
VEKNMALTRLLGLLLLLPIMVWADTDEVKIPEKFDAVATSDAGAYAFASKCIPSLTEDAFKGFVKDVSGTKSVMDRPPNSNNPFLVVNNARTICVAVSKTRQPIMPTEIFDNTISFAGMSASDVIALRVTLAQQLAQTGAASALVKNDKGNAFAIYYLFTSDTPNKIYYHMTFLKPGQYDETKFPLVMQSNGGASIKAQALAGQQTESYKVLY